MERLLTLASWRAITRGLCAAAFGLLLSVGVMGADNASDTGPIDWERARALHQRDQNGDKLSAADQAYLDHAKELIQKGEGPGRRAGGEKVDGIDMQKARELYQKSQRGETLTADEQAYLDKVKAAQNRGAPQTRPAGAGGQDGKVDGIDMRKARELFRKSQAGETLTADEQAYLDKAKATMQKRQQGGRQQQGQGTGNRPALFRSPSSRAIRNTRDRMAASTEAAAISLPKRSSMPVSRRQAKSYRWTMRANRRRTEKPC
jgi:hypothetical protein